MNAHPVTERLDFKDDRVMAAYWGDQCRTAVRDAIAQPTFTTVEDLNLLHAVRCARIAAWHALKLTTRRGGAKEEQ